jgi:hypothetical protein
MKGSYPGIIMQTSANSTNTDDCVLEDLNVLKVLRRISLIFSTFNIPRYLMHL